MKERDPFQNIIENMDADADPEKYNPEDVGCGTRLKLILLSFAQAVTSLMAWSLMFALGLAVASENLYDAGVTTAKIPFGEAFWIAVGTLVIITSIRHGTR